VCVCCFNCSWGYFHTFSHPLLTYPRFSWSCLALHELRNHPALLEVGNVRTHFWWAFQSFSDFSEIPVRLFATAPRSTLCTTPVTSPDRESWATKKKVGRLGTTRKRKKIQKTKKSKEILRNFNIFWAQLENSEDFPQNFRVMHKKSRNKS